MTLTRKQVAAIFLASVAFTGVSVEAMAKPRTYRATVANTAAGSWGSTDGITNSVRAVPNAVATTETARSYRGRRVAPSTAATAVSGEAATAFASSYSSSDLVNEARRYLGGNPTGWSRQWCGAFMDLILKRTGRKGGGNLASAYASYGARVSGPQVGAIAVMPGHVGLVTGIDSAGNPIIISGNHNRRVEEVTMPRGRITAYVMP